MLRRTLRDRSCLRGDRRGERGATFVEYIMLVGVVALLALGGFKYFGTRVRDQAELKAACVATLDGGCLRGKRPPPGALGAAGPGAASDASDRSVPPHLESGRMAALVAAAPTAGSLIQGILKPVPEPGEKRVPDVSSAKMYEPGIRIQGPPEFVARVRGDLAQLRATHVGAALLDEIKGMNRHGKKWVAITPALERAYTQPALKTMFDENHIAPTAARRADATGRVEIVKAGAGDNGVVRFDPNWFAVPGGQHHCLPSYVALAHELIHSLHMMKGTDLGGYDDPTDTKMPSPPSLEETATVGRGPYANDPLTENALRREVGIPLRDTYANTCGG